MIGLNTRNTEARALESLDSLDNNWNASEHCILLEGTPGDQSEARLGSG